MSTLSEVRERVRRDLHDEDANSYRWTDEVLNRHIERALAKVSKVSPQEKKTAKQLASDNREVSVADLTDRVVVEAIEYPVGQYPPSRVRFNQWGDTLLLNLPGTPKVGESVTVYYGALHRLTDTASTLAGGPGGACHHRRGGVCRAGMGCLRRQSPERGRAGRMAAVPDMGGGAYGRL